MLKSLGIHRALVNASGDIAIGDAPPDQTGWKIGIAPLEANGSPSRFLLMDNCGIATSGDLWQHVEIDGQRYSHIVDPRTGLGLRGRTSVTVVAPDCMTADALASSISVQGPEDGIALIESYPRSSAMVVYRQSGETRTVTSRRFTDLPTVSPENANNGKP